MHGLYWVERQGPGAYYVWRSGYCNTRQTLVKVFSTRCAASRYADRRNLEV